MPMVVFGLAAITAGCALQAIRAPRLLSAAVWLAGASAGTALLLYRLGAYQAAVIELSVGAGLVLILFVFTINLAGESNLAGPAVSRWLGGALTALIVLLLGLLAWPHLQPAPAAPSAPLSLTLWTDRPFDVLAQIVLIFTGALTVMGFLSNLSAATAEHHNEAAAAPVPEEALTLAEGAAAQAEPHPEAVP